MTAGATDHCKKCEHIGGYFIPEPEESIHNGKIVCSSCGAFIKWEGKPKTDLTDLGRWAVYGRSVDGIDSGLKSNRYEVRVEHSYNIEDWRFNFGKYNGQRIREVIETDRGYSWCKWLMTKTDFPDKCPRLIDLIEEIAEEEGIDFND